MPKAPALYSFLFAALTSGCATLITDEPSADVAPEGSVKGRKGIVLYNPHGLAEFVKERRDAAYRKIVQHCGSRRYKVTGERLVDAKEVKGGESLATFGAGELKEIAFVCD